MHAISIRNLTKVYRSGTKALKGINLDIMAGGFFALLGANGAGKTTMIGILTGVVNKTAGSVHIFNFDIDAEHDKAKMSMGVVPQEFNFNLFEKVQDIVVTQAGYFGIDRKAALAESKGILKKLGLWTKRDAPSRTLSGGMKRRLMIARALIHRPRLLILDEPTAGVDVELRHGMWEFLRELNGKGVTILLTTHYLEEAEQLCQHAAIINEGEIIKNDKVKNLVQLLGQETYLVTLERMGRLDDLSDFHPKVVDENTIELELNKKQTLTGLIARLAAMGIPVKDMRPKGHRLERLFLSILADPRVNSARMDSEQ